MPELPEVETVRLGLAPVMEGAVIDKVTLRRPDLRSPFPPRFARRLTGRRIVSLGRRAKYLLADLDDGNVLVMHLGMSGSFRIEAEDGHDIAGRYYHPRSTLRAHDHVVFDLSSGARVVFNDPRRFGMMDLVPRNGLEESRHFKGDGDRAARQRDERRIDRGAVQGAVGAAQGDAPRPEADRRHRQYLRL